MYWTYYVIQASDVSANNLYYANTGIDDTHMYAICTLYAVLHEIDEIVYLTFGQNALSSEFKNEPPF